MSVSVRVLGDLRRFTAIESTEIEGGGWSLGTALDELIRRNPELGPEIFDEQGRLHYAMVLMVGGRQASWPQDKDRAIENGGELLLTRFHSGG